MNTDRIRSTRPPVCPTCYGRPELIVVNDRHVPKYCETCKGRGVVWPK